MRPTFSLIGPVLMLVLTGCEVTGRGMSAEYTMVLELQDAGPSDLEAAWDVALEEAVADAEVARRVAELCGGASVALEVLPAGRPSADLIQRAPAGTHLVVRVRDRERRSDGNPGVQVHRRSDGGRGSRLLRTIELGVGMRDISQEHTGTLEDAVGLDVRRRDAVVSSLSPADNDPEYAAFRIAFEEHVLRRHPGWKVIRTTGSGGEPFADAADARAHLEAQAAAYRAYVRWRPGRS